MLRYNGTTLDIQHTLVCSIKQDRTLRLRISRVFRLRTREARYAGQGGPSSATCILYILTYLLSHEFNHLTPSQIPNRHHKGPGK
ncbi:hypothetical protein K431DRAFT_169384 [Polychaeton citri CBS 116435]|uniref:Uncharacterized protein n=1 Tax=Polychaeton citri CBS 116435 TaxID=1314669 RepID=A0A9P4PZU3_9PEZI|nr:hypothetical protein K431DRAFT_169384 [Polychaeton citri CBS 116435]